ncbi:MAG: lysophospholipid acyltransferase family protein [Gammaproteobacteria bacterium]
MTESTPKSLSTANAPARSRKPLRRFFLHKVLPPFGWRMYRALGRSWAYDEEDVSILHDLVAARQPVVGAFYHSRTFALLHYFSLPAQGRWILMCSQSRDGEAMARIEEGLGFRVARGSSGKGGARALVEMIKAQRDDRGLNSCLAIDGSRGPRGIAQLGTITLAQKTGSLLLPVAASASPCWRWNAAWDRTLIPKPGATVRVRIGQPIDVPAKLDEDGYESIRRLLEERMFSLHSTLDQQTGYHDPEPLRVPAV